MAQQSDEFDGPSINPAWKWVREYPAYWSLGGGELTIHTQTGALNGTMFNNVQNILLQEISGTFPKLFETHLKFTAWHELHNAGLIYYIDDDNYIRVSLGGRGYYKQRIWMEWEIDGQTFFHHVSLGFEDILDFSLRLAVHEGGRFVASYGYYEWGSGMKWYEFSDKHIVFPDKPASIGLQAANGDGVYAQYQSLKARFSYFRVLTPTSVHPLPDRVPRASIEVLYPSPVRQGDRVHIRFRIDRPGLPRYMLTDMLGREVLPKTSLGRVSAGEHGLTLSLDDAVPGVYLFHLEVEGARTTRRLLVTR